MGHDQTSAYKLRHRETMPRYFNSTSIHSHDTKVSGSTTRCKECLYVFNQRTGMDMYKGFNTSENHHVIFILGVFAYQWIAMRMT